MGSSMPGVLTPTVISLSLSVPRMTNRYINITVCDNDLTVEKEEKRKYPTLGLMKNGPHERERAPQRF
jgi:hypothetical protein